MAKDTYPDLEKLCRLCLRSEIGIIDIFTNEVNNQLSIPVRIMTCAALEVQSGDGLPKMICSECRYQLEKSYYFRKKCQLSHSVLKKHLRLLSAGKKSYVFSRMEEDDIFGELELEDSLKFIMDKEAEKAREEKIKHRQWKEEFRNKIKEECLNECKDEIRAQCKDELRMEVEYDIVNELKLNMNKISNEEEISKLTTMTDVRKPLLLQLYNECIMQAKAELRDELGKRYREEEIERLLQEMQLFLQYRGNSKIMCGKTDQNLNKFLKGNCVMNSIAKSNNIFVSSPKVEKGYGEGLTEIKKRKGEKNTENCDSEISSPDHRLTFTNVESKECNDINAGLESYYILAEDEEGQDDNVILTDDNGLSLEISEPESPDNDTIYQIEDNGNIHFVKKEYEKMADCRKPESGTNGILIFDADFEPGGNVEHAAVDVHDLEKKPLVMNIGEEDISTKEILIKRIPNLCDSNISNETGRTYHFKGSDATKTFQCPECPQLFTTESSMLRHVTMHRRLEEKGVRYQCPLCHVFLSCKSALNRHMVKHTGKRPFVCQECGKSFIQREILKRHMLTHSGIRPYECQQCERSFTQKLNLVQHINKCHTENPKIHQYSCHLCPKRFNHASGLSRHLATHSGVVFQCTECERNFTDRSSVKRHIVHVHGAGNTEKMRLKNTVEDRVQEIYSEKDSDTSAEDKLAQSASHIFSVSQRSCQIYE